MIGKSKAGIVVAGTIAILAIGGVAFIGSGVYNIGADDHHTKIVLALIEQLRDHSIESRARTIEARFVTNPARIADGAQNYAALCVGCHLAPGVTKSDIRQGLYPHPPNLAQEELQPAQRAFWIIKHGIKMSAMPAWGKTLDDDAIWNIVAFIRKMPDMTPDSYQRLSQNRAGVELNGS
jgi:mono/diheme cytochrome c family protein